MGLAPDCCRQRRGSTMFRTIGTVFSTFMSLDVNTLTAAELKRRGMAAIEERLRHGPVHLVKRNRAAAVVLTEQQYADLSQGKPDAGQPGMTAMQWLLSQPATGSKSRRQIERELRAEREKWA